MSVPGRAGKPRGKPEGAAPRDGSLASAISCLFVSAVAKRKSLFDDKAVEIEELTYIIKQVSSWESAPGQSSLSCPALREPSTSLQSRPQAPRSAESIGT